MALKKRGDRWLATVFRGYEASPDGKQRRLEHSRTFDLKKDAERWIREQRGQVERGDWVKPSEITLNSFLDQWQQGALRLGPQRERTKRSYRELLITYIRPSLGHVRLDQLTKAVVQRTAAELLTRPVMKGGRAATPKEGEAVRTLSPSTVRRALAALAVALSEAVEQKLIGSNPAIGIKLPRGERNVPRWLNREELRRLIDGTSTDRHGCLWALLATTGMRPSEALGLRWENVDLANGVIRVREALVPHIQVRSGKRWSLEEPKTARSKRAVPMPAETVRSLQRQRAAQAAERLAAGSEYLDHGAGGFVFAQDRGDPYREDALMQLFRRTLAKLGLPTVTLYSLRHGHASLLLEAGVPLKVVSERLGHSSIQLTADTYSHVSDQMQQKAVEQFASYLGATAQGAT